LSQHRNDLKGKQTAGKHIKQHVKDCDCQILFNKTKVTHNIRSKVAREVLEAFLIVKGGDRVISEPSITISKLEIEMMERDRYVERMKMMG
jgi:hypothetical protein